MSSVQFVWLLLLQAVSSVSLMGSYHVSVDWMLFTATVLVVTVGCGLELQLLVHLVLVGLLLGTALASLLPRKVLFTKSINLVNLNYYKFIFFL